MTDLVTITITGPDTESMTNLGRHLVEARLAACVNLVPGVRSIYRWDDSLADDAEVLALVHSTPDRVPAIIAAVQERHPYDTAQIVALGALDAAADYERWVHDSVIAPGDDTMTEEAAR